MKLDYEIEVDEDNSMLTLIIFKQDERFWKKEDDGKVDSFEYKCKNGFIIRSNYYLSLSKICEVSLRSHFIKPAYCCKHFNTLEELNEYKEKLIEALEEFKLYEPDNNLTKKNFHKRRNY